MFVHVCVKHAAGAQFRNTSIVVRHSCGSMHGGPAAIIARSSLKSGARELRAYEARKLAAFQSSQNHKLLPRRTLFVTVLACQRNRRYNVGRGANPFCFRR